MPSDPLQRREFLARTALGDGATIAAAEALAQPAAAPQKPNVLWLFGDQQRISWHG